MSFGSRGPTVPKPILRGRKRSKHAYYPFSHTPPKINIEPENDGLESMIFLFQGARILRWTSR